MSVRFEEVDFFAIINESENHNINDPKVLPRDLQGMYIVGL